MLLRSFVKRYFSNTRKKFHTAPKVTIYSFVDEPELLRISTEIYVDRNSQKGILIGKGGEALKKTGTAARKELEAFLVKRYSWKCMYG